jgi:hypothetical protein
MKNRIINLTVYTYIVLFLYTGLSKIVDFNVFVVTLSVSPIAKNHAELIAIAVPVVELIVVALLLIPKTKRIGLISSFVLMVVFTAYVALILGTSKRLPCSCGGIFYKITWRPHLYLNIFLTFMAAVSLYFMKRKSWAN